MTRSKKLFMGAAAIFLVFLTVVIWDMGRRTTFPGKGRKGTGEREAPADSIKKTGSESDSLGRW